MGRLKWFVDIEITEIGELTVRFTAKENPAI
jgi:hypothetical protein